MRQNSPWSSRFCAALQKSALRSAYICPICTNQDGTGKVRERGRFLHHGARTMTTYSCHIVEAELTTTSSGRRRQEEFTIMFDVDFSVANSLRSPDLIIQCTSIVPRCPSHRHSNAGKPLRSSSGGSVRFYSPKTSSLEDRTKEKKPRRWTNLRCPRRCVIISPPFLLPYAV